MLVLVVGWWGALAARLSLPQRLAWAATAGYVLVLALLVAYGRPGGGLGQLFFIPIVLAALATDLPIGAAAGAGAAIIYVGVLSVRTPAIHDLLFSSRTALHLVSYIAAGAIAGAFARRARLLLGESLQMLDGLLELAHRDVGSGALSGEGLDAAVAQRMQRRWPFTLLLGELESLSTQLASRRADDRDRVVRDALRRVASTFGADADVARAGPTRLAVLVAAASPEDAREAAASAERAFARDGRCVTFGWAYFPADGADGLSLVQAASERLHARRIVRGEWKPTAASAGLVDVLRATDSTTPGYSTT